MDYEQFEIGDVVFLKSGSPRLTVFMIESGAADAGNLIDVSWFAGDELRRDAFSARELTKIDPVEPSIAIAA